MIGIGAFADVHLATSTKAKLFFADGSTTTEVQPNGVYYKRFSISPLLAVGGKYWLNESSYLKIEPTLHAPAPARGYVWRTGLNIGYYKRM